MSIQSIHKNMMINEVIRRFPETVAVFQRHGMECISCSAAQFETIEQGAKAHSINVVALIKDLNQTILRKI